VQKNQPPNKDESRLQPALAPSVFDRSQLVSGGAGLPGTSSSRRLRDGYMPRYSVDEFEWAADELTSKFLIHVEDQL
jgi:hypothetical protein